MSFFIYCLIVYFLFFVIARSRIMAKTRAWAHRMFPEWLVYPFICPICFAWWFGILLTLIEAYRTKMVIDLSTLMAAPVMVLIIDGVVQYLDRINNQPPFIDSHLPPDPRSIFNPLDHEQMR